MYKTKYYNLRKHINPDIKVGDQLYLIDGSGLLPVKEYKDPIFIVSSYPELFGTEEIIKDLKFTVVQTNIEDIITPSVVGTALLLDCLIEYNGCQLYTCSYFLSDKTSDGDYFMDMYEDDWILVMEKY